ncbi:MAG: bacillithiol system redox-active protein YtxJ [Ginsengibacter sp.]
MNWISLTSTEQLQALKQKSQEQPQVIFKHSTRCSISSMVKSRLDKGAQPTGADFYYLDLIKYRDISNKISQDFNVYHESPQVMIIKNGESIYDESHSGIDLQEIASNLI